jgi:hypothetical protein
MLHSGLSYGELPNAGKTGDSLLSMPLPEPDNPIGTPPPKMVISSTQDESTSGSVALRQVAHRAINEASCASRG